MTGLQLVTSMLGQAILWAVLLLVLCRGMSHKIPQWNFVLPVLVILAIAVPVHGLTVGEWLRSVIGDPSILSMIVFSDIASRRLWQYRLVQDETRRWLLRGIALTGLMFYPLVLGMTSLDPYAWGYSPQLLGTLIAVVSFVVWQKGRRNLAVILLLPLPAFHLSLLESVNLWDYLMDPVIFVYAVVQVWFLQARKK